MKKRGSEPDRLPQSAAGVQNVWIYVTALLILLHSVVQVENFTASTTPPCQKAIEKLKFSIQFHVYSFV
jgi:hypothetical protein